MKTKKLIVSSVNISKLNAFQSLANGFFSLVLGIWLGGVALANAIFFNPLAPGCEVFLFKNVRTKCEGGGMQFVYKLGCQEQRYDLSSQLSLALLKSNYKYLPKCFLSVSVSRIIYVFVGILYSAR